MPYLLTALLLPRQKHTNPILVYRGGEAAKIRRFSEAWIV